MAHLCFGTYDMEIKKAKFPLNGNVKVVELLLSLITDTIPIYNKQSKKDIQLKKPKSLLLSAIKSSEII